MDLHTAKTEEICPRSEIALYLDGELIPAAEIALEKHFAECKSCLDELNLQKKMLSALDFAFDDKAEEIELPANFAKIVATTAESNVSGLRSKKERSLALFLCSAMFLAVMLGLGAETEKVFEVFRTFAEQLIVVLGFVFHFIYGLTIGLSIILKFLSQQIVFNSAASLLIIIGAFFISFVALSRMVTRSDR
jgi:hypothetical protein